MRGDFFYYNQYTVDRFNKRLVALGIEHIHYINVKDLKAVSIKEFDGDHPSQQ
jgi:hypothetical protein